MQWFTPVIPAPGVWTQENHRVKGILTYIVQSQLEIWETIRERGERRERRKKEREGGRDRIVMYLVLTRELLAAVAPSGIWRF